MLATPLATCAFNTSVFNVLVLNMQFCKFTFNLLVFFPRVMVWRQSVTVIRASLKFVPYSNYGHAGSRAAVVWLVVFLSSKLIIHILELSQRLHLTTFLKLPYKQNYYGPMLAKSSSTSTRFHTVCTMAWWWLKLASMLAQFRFIAGPA